MNLIYATKNQGKLSAMKNILKGLDMVVTGLDEIDIPLPEVEENGNDPLENAEIKALMYYKAIRRPLFSVDSGLFFEGLPAELQPGVHVRNVKGKRLSDEEMIEYYSCLAREAGGQLTAQYVNGICLIVSEGEIYKHTGDDISYSRFILADKPHKKRIEGFPLDSLSIHIGSGEYYYDLKKDGNNFHLENESDRAFKNFFIKSLNLQQEKFI